MLGRITMSLSQVQINATGWFPGHYIKEIVRPKEFLTTAATINNISKPVKVNDASLSPTSPEPPPSTPTKISDAREPGSKSKSASSLFTLMRPSTIAKPRFAVTDEVNDAGSGSPDGPCTYLGNCLCADCNKLVK